MSKLKELFLRCLQYILFIGFFSGSIMIGGYILDYKIEIHQPSTSTTSTVSTDTSINETTISKK